MQTLTGAALAVSLFSSANAQVRYQLIDLGPVQNFRAAYGYDVNEAGQVTGDAVNSSFRTHPFLWTDGVIQDLGVLGNPSMNDSYGRGLNIHGHVVGHTYVGDRDDQHAFFHNGVQMIDLGVLPGGAWSFAKAVNDNDVVVGWSESANGRRAFRWTSGSGMVDLGSPNGSASFAQDINEDGDIVGYFDVVLQDHAFMYRNGIWTDLGTFPGADWAQAFGINNNREIVGWARDTNDDEYAFVWRNGTMTNLGSLPDRRFRDFIGSIAYDINDAGIIVGDSLWDTGQIIPAPEATIWYDGAPLRLINLVQNAGNWVLDSAYAVNNRGQIVGTGKNGGPSHAFLLNPVYPNGVFLVNSAAEHATFVIDPQTGLPVASFDATYARTGIEVIDGNGSDLLMSDLSLDTIHRLRPDGSRIGQFNNLPIDGIKGIAKSVSGYIVGATPQGFAAWKSNGVGGLESAIRDPLNDIEVVQFGKPTYLITNDLNDRLQAYKLNLKLLGQTQAFFTTPEQCIRLRNENFAICDSADQRIYVVRTNGSLNSSFAVTGNPRGVAEVSNGNLLISTNQGVHLYTQGGKYLRTVLSNREFWYISRSYNYSVAN